MVFVMEQRQEENLVRILHTELPDRVFQKFRTYAQGMATARGHWDFGIAIERLLDNASFDARIAFLEEQIALLSMNKQEQDIPKQEEKKSNDMELLGGYTEKGEVKNEN